MFSMVRWLLAVLLCLLVVGLFRGWFSFSNPGRDPDQNQINVNVSVDRDKVRTDAQQFTEKVAERIKENRDGDKD